jgi:hypothetical protein
MRPWNSERSERERERQREGARIPLYIEPPSPTRPREDLRRAPSQEEPRGWCVIDDTVDTSIDTAI